MTGENAIENIIFDLDGTLIDSVEDIFDCLKRSYERANIPLTVHLDIRFIGPPLSAMIRNITPGITEQKVQSVVKAFREYYDNCPLTRTRLRPGMQEAIHLLEQKGITMFLVTNKPKNATSRILEHLQLDHFKDIVNPDSLPNRHLSKVDMIAFVIRDHHIDPSQTLMVGDSAADVEAARQHDIECVAIQNGYGDPQKIINSKPLCVIHGTEEFTKTVLKIINKEEPL